MAPVWISPLHKSKQVPKIRISSLETSIYKCIYAHNWIPKKDKPKYVHTYYMHLWISPMEKSISLTTGWISSMEKSKLAQTYKLN